MYLASTITALLLAALPMQEIQAQSVCDPDFFGCTMEVDPVCGFDGDSYIPFNSNCELWVAQCTNSALTLAYPCECNDQGTCDDGFDPLPQVTDGCDGFAACPDDYDPVCGIDNGESKPFPNQCALDQAKCDSPTLKLAYSCECNDQNTCDDGAEPTTPEPTTPEPTTPPPTPKCPVETFKICDSDGKTYEDAKAFLAARLLNAVIKFESIGECDAPPQTLPPVSESATGDVCAFICTTPNLYEPVCTPTNIIFQNQCTYLRAVCCDSTLPLASAMYCNPLLK